jgi:hypothetical protein
VAQRTDEAPSDRLDHVSCSAGADGGDVSIRGGLALNKARREVGLGAIEIDPLSQGGTIPDAGDPSPGRDDAL